MKQIMLLIVVSTFVYASYNPFFQDTTVPKQTTKVIVKKVLPKPNRTVVKITYFGFVESNKGKFALIKIDNKNIVIKQKDSIYIGERVVKVLKLSSNYIVLKDGRNTPQTIYFSSKNQRNNNDR